MRALDQNNAMVLFSGGQDSAIALAWALDRFARVETVGFDYGQRHAVELQARLRLREAFAARGVPLRTLLTKSCWLPGVAALACASPRLFCLAQAPIDSATATTAASFNPWRKRIGYFIRSLHAHVSPLLSGLQGVG